MSKFDITYTVEAENVSHAAEIAYSHVYLADVEVDGVTIKAQRITDSEDDGLPDFPTFGEVSASVARRIVEPHVD
jgi:hypothetical protein